MILLDIHTIVVYNECTEYCTEKRTNMIAVNYSTIRENLKSYCDKVTDEQETVIVTRKDEKNVVIISLTEWNEMQRAIKNAEYLGKLNRSIEDIKSGRVITKTIEDLEDMANG